MKKILILLISLIVISCNQLTPSNFWLNYETEKITDKKNDQGPWGGILAINWKANKNEKFNISELKKVAEKNNWKLIDSLSFNESELNNMAELNQSIIRLPLKNFTPNPKELNYTSTPLPRWINTSSKLYIFKTNLLIFESGTDDSTNENGFILFSKNEKEFSIYQVWGE